jgi:hypothetical protein
MGVNLIGESDADACRRMGWGVGTQIVGDEGFGPTVWEITAIGRSSILTVTINGGRDKRECLSSLTCRDWTKYKDLHNG